MKKIISILALCALTMSANAAYRVYLCGITELSIDTLQSNTKNQFTLNFHQKCKNTAEYSKPETFYESDIKLVLNSDDRTLEGTYTTEGASTTSSSANVNDQTINLITSEFTSGTTSRALRKDSISTFTIEKIDDTHYAITTGDLFFSKRVDQTTDTWEYRYSYDPDHILEQGIAPTPFVFGWEAGYFEAVYHYDITVNSLAIEKDVNDYETVLYRLTLGCTGVERETSASHEYEIELTIYPYNDESIVASYSTQNSSDVLSTYSYVQDKTAGRKRYLESDSVSTVRIQSNGANQYLFYGGTLICTDIDLNYSAVYGIARNEAVHYYHFGAEPIPFNWDGGQGTAIENTADEQPKAQKIMREGQVLILRGDKQYNVLGAEQH